MTRLTRWPPAAAGSRWRGPILGYEGHRGHAGEFADQVCHAVHLLRAALLHREQHRIDGRSRTMRMASEMDSRWRMAKHPVPAASTRERSPGESMAATVGEPAALDGAAASMMALAVNWGGEGGPLRSTGGQTARGAAGCNDRATSAGSRRPRSMETPTGPVPRGAFSPFPNERGAADGSTHRPDLRERLQRALGPQYRLERELGRGGMGVVFLASDTTLDRRVAIKVVHPELDPSRHRPPVPRRSPHHRAAPAPRHRGGARRRRADGLLYYVMDQVEGESLRQRLRRERAARAVVMPGASPPMSPRRSMRRRGPAWSTATSSPRTCCSIAPPAAAMLADFGIARAMAGEPEGDGPTTGQGVAVGTPTYMSPEQAAGEEVDARSDLYALGVVAYEMLAGAPPFTGAQPRRRLEAHRRAPGAGGEGAARQSRRHLPPPSCARSRSIPPSAGRPARRFGRRSVGEARPRPASRAARRASRRWRARPGARQRLARSIGLAAATARPAASIPGTRSSSCRSTTCGTTGRWTGCARAASACWRSTSSQWNDLTVVDHERLHDLLAASHSSRPGDAVGLDMARRLAREAGVWTVVLGEFTRGGDRSISWRGSYDVASGTRVDVARVERPAGDDVRPLFDQLAAKLLDLPARRQGVRVGLARATTGSLEAYRAYLTASSSSTGGTWPGAERDSAGDRRSTPPSGSPTTSSR